MGVEHEPRLLEALKALVGGSVRVVATYDSEGYDVIYTRDDVRERVRTHADEVHDELVLQGISRSHLEELFHAGTLHCTMHRFDELTAFHFGQEEYTGVFVSIDSDASVDLDDFAGTVRAQLE